MDAGTSFIFSIVLLVLSSLQITQQSRLDPESKSTNDLGDYPYRETSGGTSSSSKISTDDYSSLQSGSENTKKQLKILNAYEYHTAPLEPKYYPEKIDMIRKLEEDLSKTGSSFPWVDIGELPSGYVRRVCADAFRQESIGIEILEGMNPDCVVTKSLGLTKVGKRGQKYYGIFEFYEPNEKENEGFYADYLRCNCAYTKISKTGVLQTVPKSKRFFFLLKRCETLYYVASLIGEIRHMRRNRNVKIINVLEVPETNNIP